MIYEWRQDKRTKKKVKILRSGTSFLAFQSTQTIIKTITITKDNPSI